MQERSKKLLSLGLACIMTVSLLAGCGSEKEETTSSSSDSTPQNTESTNAADASDEVASGEADAETDPLWDPLVYGKYDEEVTITVAKRYHSSMKMDENDPDIKSLDENIWYRTYQEDLGIKVENLWTADINDWGQKWTTAMATSDLPDFGLVSPQIYQQLLEADLVMDMTDIFEEYASDLYKEAVERENNICYEALTKNGRLYGLPYVGDTPEGAADYLFIRQDWLDAVNMEVPTTIDELEAVMDAFMEAELGGPDTVGIASSNAINGETNFIGGLLEGYGAYYQIWLEGDNELIYSPTTDEFKAALLRLQEWYKKGYVREDFLTRSCAVANEDIASGKCGILYGVFWSPLSGGIATSYVNDENAEWVVAEIPTLDGSKPVIEGRGGATVSRDCFFVNKDCEHPEAIVKLLNFGLAVGATGENPKYPQSEYCTREDGTEVFWYSLHHDMNLAWSNLNTHYVCMEALEAGTDENVPANAQYTYDELVKAQTTGDRESKDWEDIFGLGGVYDLMGQEWDEGRLIQTAFLSGKTETMMAKEADLLANLSSAIYKVIMGEDISVYEEALDTWYKTGGEQITKEVNDWYKSK